MIPVSYPFLPAQESYKKYLDKIWSARFLTNDGPLLKELEIRLKERLGVQNLLIVNNGTVALEMAINSLGDQFSSYVTSPFSFAATLTSLKWLGRKNIQFCDIHPQNWNVDISQLKKMDLQNSLGVFVHVYGNPCDVVEIEKLQKENKNFKVIYDAAHAFGTQFKGHSVLNCGDISTLSFHATKIFQTVEGGAVICKDEQIYHDLKKMRNFGIDSFKSTQFGTNGKMSEFHAAMGLSYLEHFDEIQGIFKNNWETYYKYLNEYVVFPMIHSDVNWNYSYCSFLLPSEEKVIQVMDELQKIGVLTRRYFYPSLNVAENVFMDRAEDVSKRVICCPIHTGVQLTKIQEICECIKLCLS